MKTTKLPAFRPITVFLILFTAMRVVCADTFTWTGTASSDWSNPANWNPTGPPGTNDTAVITNGAASITGTSAVLNISLGGNASLTLAGGTILNAMVSTTNGAWLVVHSGTLDGVTVNGVLDVGYSWTSALLTVTNGLVLNGMALVGNPANTGPGRVDFAGSQVLGGNGTVVFGNRVTGCDPDMLRVANADTTLVVGPGIMVHGADGVIGSGANYCYGGPANVSVANQGIISADVRGGTITIAGGNLSNGGTLDATNGGTLQLNSGTMVNSGTITEEGGFVVMGGSWSNSGVIQGVGGTLNLGGSFSLAAAGTLKPGNGAVVYLTGTLDNTNTTLVVDGAVAPWGLAGGTIAGGTVVTTNGAWLVVHSGTLDGVTVNGVLDVGYSWTSALLTVTNGLVLNGMALVGNPANTGPGRVDFAGSQVLGGNGTVVFGNRVTGCDPDMLRVANADTTLVVGPGIMVHGADGVIGSGANYCYGGPANVSVANQGIISADVSGGTITIAGGNLSNGGTLDATNGGTLQLNSGSTMNSGTITVETGTITFPNSFTQTSGTLNFGLNGPIDYGQIKFAGSATLGGTLAAHLNNGFAPVIGDAFAVLNYGNNNPSFTNASFSHSYVWQTESTNGVLSLVVQALVQISVTVSPANSAVPVGSNVTFQASASGAGPLSYQWLFNGNNVAGATNSILSLTDVTRPQAGRYAIVVSNPVGTVTSTPPAMLTIANSLACPNAPGGMVAWWRGDGDTSDYAGTNDAVFEGTAAYGPGEVGQAFSFDGTSSFLQVANSPSWDFGTNDFSFEFWANFAAVNSSIAAGDGSVVFLGHAEESGARDKWLVGFGGGELYLYVNGTGVGAHLLAQTAFNPNTNQWYHLGLTKAGGVYRIYMNGVAVSSATNTLAIPAANAPLTIGQAGGLFMQGLLDEISIYNRALTPVEIQAIYQAGSQGKCSTTQPLTIAQAVFNSGGKFQFQILGGQAGATIQVQTSIDLTTWVNVWQATLGASPLIFTDTAPTPKPQLYYRVLANP